MSKLIQPNTKKSGRAETAGDDFFFSKNKPAEQDDFYADEGQLCCDVYQDAKNIIIKSTIAGVDPKDLDISVSNDLLTIRGWREMDEEIDDRNFFSRECYWGTFSRSIVLPQEVEQNKTKATLKNGILTIILPKKFHTSSIKVKNLDE